MCLSNFKAIRQFKVPISWLRDFMRSYEKTSFRILRRGPVRLKSRPMFMHDNGLTFITNFMINCYRCVADAMAGICTEPSATNRPGWPNLVRFKYDWHTLRGSLDFCQTEPEIGLIFLLLNMIFKEVYRFDVCFAGHGPRTGDFTVTDPQGLIPLFGKYQIFLFYFFHKSIV